MSVELVIVGGGGREVFVVELLGGCVGGGPLWVGTCMPHCLSSASTAFMICS